MEQRPTVGDDNTFVDNAALDHWSEGDLPVPSQKLAVPSTTAFE